MSPRQWMLPLEFEAGRDVLFCEDCGVGFGKVWGEHDVGRTLAPWLHCVRTHHRVMSHRFRFRSFAMLAMISTWIVKFPSHGTCFRGSSRFTGNKCPRTGIAAAVPIRWNTCIIEIFTTASAASVSASHTSILYMSRLGLGRIPRRKEPPVLAGCLDHYRGPQEVVELALGSQIHQHRIIPVILRFFWLKFHCWRLRAKVSLRLPTQQVACVGNCCLDQITRCVHRWCKWRRGCFLVHCFARTGSFVRPWKWNLHQKGNRCYHCTCRLIRLQSPLRQNGWPRDTSTAKTCVHDSAKTVQSLRNAVWKSVFFSLDSPTSVTLDFQAGRRGYPRSAVFSRFSYTCTGRFCLANFQWQC